MAPMISIGKRPVVVSELRRFDQVRLAYRN